MGEEYSLRARFLPPVQSSPSIAADERDVDPVSGQNYRKDEEVYLYRTTVSPEQARTNLP